MEAVVVGAPEAGTPQNSSSLAEESLDCFRANISHATWRVRRLRSFSSSFFSLAAFEVQLLGCLRAWERGRRPQKPGLLLVGGVVRYTRGREMKKATTIRT
jgi:hypothetical protein